MQSLTKRIVSLGFVLLLGVGPVCAEPVVGGLSGRGIEDERLRGLTLLSELNCTACHQPDQGSGLIVRHGGPRLETIGSRASARHLQRFIAQPNAVKAGTTMPDVLSHLPAQKRNRVALAITHHLLSTGGSPLPPISPGSKAKGQKLYSTIGCIACHGAANDAVDRVPLGQIADKYQLSSLAEFLKDPLRHRPNGRMPDLQLTHFEAVDLATYLLRDQKDTLKLTVDPLLARKGQGYFSEYGCVQCHGDAAKIPGSHRPLAKLRLDQGCLSQERGPWPDFHLAPRQKKELRRAIVSRNEELLPEQQIVLRLAQLNCLACHQRGEVGGVPDSMDAHFTGADPNLGDQGRLPPTLTGVGAKLKPEALRKILLHGDSVRPYMNTRMPRFGAANVEALVDLFGAVDHLDPPIIDRVKDTKLAKKAGGTLAGNRGLNCVACHTFRHESAAPIRALDLTTMADRLQENWFHQYLRHPQGFQPLTIMPSFWPSGKAILTNVLDGNTGHQIDALWQYLSHGRNVRAPSGIVLEPLPLVVGDEAVMLRRNYRDIGKRGIGVGYPAKINLSFDAGQVRLASIWRGDFIEASPAWRGQGSGAVRILGTDLIKFPDGPALAILNDPQEAWPTNQARQLPGFDFKGYTLDKLQRPTFAYEFRGIPLTDRFIDRLDEKGRPYFERQIRFTSSDPRPDIYLRIANDQDLRRIDANTVQVGRPLRIRSSKGALIRGRELLLLLDAQAEHKIEYHW